MGKERDLAVSKGRLQQAAHSGRNRPAVRAGSGQLGAERRHHVDERGRGGKAAG